jgi:hypothetical protein
MDVRLGTFGLTARADRPHDLALADRRANADSDRAEVDEGDRVAVLGTDRQAAALPRQLPCKRDHPCRRGAHFGSRRRADVDSSVLAARIRIAFGDERPEHRAFDRPAPRGRA